MLETKIMWPWSDLKLEPVKQIENQHIKLTCCDIAYSVKGKHAEIIPADILEIESPIPNFKNNYICNTMSEALDKNCKPDQLLKRIDDL